jgi:hypothetical protein
LSSSINIPKCIIIYEVTATIYTLTAYYESGVIVKTIS